MGFVTGAVLAYQVGIVVLLFAAAALGKPALCIATALLVLWTCTHVFFPPLMLLQFVVIGATAQSLGRELDRVAPK